MIFTTYLTDDVNCTFFPPQLFVNIYKMFMLIKCFLGVVEGADSKCGQIKFVYYPEVDLSLNSTPALQN